MLFPKSAYTISQAVADGPFSRSHIFKAMKDGILPFRYMGKTRVITGDALRAHFKTMEQGDALNPKMDRVAENLGHE